jgi:hypothetical protein
MAWPNHRLRIERKQMNFFDELYRASSTTTCRPIWVDVSVAASSTSMPAIDVTASSRTIFAALPTTLHTST